MKSFSKILESLILESADEPWNHTITISPATKKAFLDLGLIPSLSFDEMDQDVTLSMRIPKDVMQGFEEPEEVDFYFDDIEIPDSAISMVKSDIDKWVKRHGSSCSAINEKEGSYAVEDDTLYYGFELKLSKPIEFN